MRPWLFFIGDVGVPAYWALLMIGFMVAIYLSWRMARQAGIDTNRILDLNLIILLCCDRSIRIMPSIACLKLRILSEKENGPG